MPSKTLREAEKAALDGANESQDTLVIAHYLMMNYGVGVRSSSPSAAQPRSLPSPKRSRPPNEIDRINNPDYTEQLNEQTRGTRGVDSQSQAYSIPETQDLGVDKGTRAAVAPPSCDAADEDGVVEALNLSDSFPQRLDQPPEPLSGVGGAPEKKRMDSTQSTQSNVGRSYDRYTRPQGSSKPAGGSSPRHGTVGDADDTDDVRFDFITVGTNKTVSPGQDDSGFVDFGGLANLRHAGSQKTGQSPTQHLPETPAQPQNPFRYSRSQLLPTSQLFQGTQFSSPVKLASPTSSRPSPADFPGNPISPNPVISSPLKARGLRSSPVEDLTSSPEILPGTASSRFDDSENNPVNIASTENGVVPESSHGGRTMKRSGPEPMTTYDPMHKSQQRRSSSEARSDPGSSGEDDDGYDSLVRRRKAKSKKEAALKQLTAISFPRRLKSEDVEVPSTSHRRRTSEPGAHSGKSNRQHRTGNDSEDADAVQDSQERRLPSVQHRTAEDEGSTQSGEEDEVEPVIDPMSTAVPLPPRSLTKSANQPARDSDIEGTSNAEAIPETSPVGRLLGLTAELQPSGDPPIPEAKSTPNFPSSPPALRTRSKNGTARRVFARESSSSSSLSNLASTPQLPSSNTSETASTSPAGSPTGSTIVASSSPAVAHTKRRDARGRLPRPKTGSTESLRQSIRVARRDSNSTDELSRPASATPTFEQSMRVSRLSVSRSASRMGRTAMKPPPIQRGQKLFENMAFAISFQSRKPGETNEQYIARTDFSIMVQKRIKQAGGRILESGFDELFEVSTIGPLSSSPVSSAGTEADISLTTEGRSTGFTALIADGHSRKVKYMQALALGIPCIAARWVTTCLGRNELVDWSPYLLCAGQSAFLGDAIRSRSLTPYNAATARLADIISQREKLLEGSRILTVMRKSSEGKKMAYVFLARVLGASLTRVQNVEEAKAEMKAAEESGRPFDWVYVDGKPDEEALFASGSAGGKKRKRISMAAHPVKRVRTLSDELVIQSLILGRLIEEGEMEG